MLCARSMILTGSPMSRTKISPRPPIEPAWMTSDTASGVVMKKRVISGCVTVTGPPLAIWRLKIRITDPAESSTFPKRTATKRVDTSCREPYASTIHSQSAFDCPYTACAFSALSVEISTKRRAPNSTATSATTFVASTLLRTDSSGFASIIGTCL